MGEATSRSEADGLAQEGAKARAGPPGSVLLRVQLVTPDCPCAIADSGKLSFEFDHCEGMTCAGAGNINFINV